MSNAAALRQEFWALPPEAIVDRATVSAALYLSIHTMESFATRGGGPRYRRVGRRAMYRKSEVLEWAEDSGRTVENTAQLANS